MTRTGKKNFGDIDYYQQKETYKQDIYDIINELQELHHNRFYKTTLQKCRGAVVPIKGLDDPGRLPTTLKALNPTKIDCVASTVCWLITAYWDFCGGERENAEFIDAHLAELVGYVACGLDAYEVTGTRSKGYFLRLKG